MPLPCAYYEYYCILGGGRYVPGSASMGTAMAGVDPFTGTHFSLPFLVFRFLKFIRTFM